MDPATRGEIERVLDAEVTGTLELSGGMVGTVYRVTFTNRRPIAAKVGDTPLELEARMLSYLASESPVPVPDVLHAAEDLLLLEYVEGDDTWTPATERDVADHVAALHDCTAQANGFPFETLSGPYSQPNPWTDSWIEFFREHRLEQFAVAAHEEGTLPAETLARVRALAGRLPDLLIEPDRPALLHGDLWAGNLIVADQSLEAVLDPAIYFGHDELELAYVENSGELGEAFLDRYRERRGIDDGYEQRRAVYQAFHTLENVRFFGERLLPDLREQLDGLGV